MNQTKNCFAISAPFAWKQPGGTIGESQTRLYHSLKGPVRVTLPNNEVYQIPILGVNPQYRGQTRPSLDTLSLRLAFDFLQGYT
eukprot:1016252-Amphidinium_carterae.1